MLTLALIIIVFYFLVFHYTPPAEPLALAGDGPTVTEDCGADQECLAGAVKGRCRVVTFNLMDPNNESNRFIGTLLGRQFDACEARIEDPLSGKSMACSVTEISLWKLRQLEGLETFCSGNLLGQLKF